MAKKKVLIIGATGQLGSALVRAMQDSHEIIGTCHDSKVKGLMDLEITDKKQVEKVLSKAKPDIVINTAAMTHVDKCEENPKLAKEINVEGNKNVLEQCKANNISYVFISTYYVFDGGNNYYFEDDPTNSLNEYGKTKAQAEKDCLAYTNSLVIRASKIYSYGLDNRNFLARVIDSLKSNKQVFVSNDQFTNPINAEDLAIVIKELIDANKKGIYHVGGPDYLNNYDFVKLVVDILNYNPDLIVKLSSEEFESKFKIKTKRPMRCALDVSKLFTETMYRPRSVAEYIKSLKGVVK